MLIYRLAEKAGLARAPAPSGHELLVNYRGGAGTFPMVAYHRVLTGEVPPEVFAGKIVLVGTTTPTLHDIFPTPFASQSGMPGVEIHSHTLETLLQGIPLRRFSPLLLPLVALLAAARPAWTATPLPPLRTFFVRDPASLLLLRLTSAALLASHY